MNSVEALDVAIRLVGKQHETRAAQLASVRTFKAGAYEQVQAQHAEMTEALETLTALRDVLAEQGLS